MSSLENFLQYDFQNNKDWIDYKNRLEIPQGKENSEALLKFKARWYQKNIDASLQVDGLLSKVKDDVNKQRAQEQDSQGPEDSYKQSNSQSESSSQPKATSQQQSSSQNNNSNSTQNGQQSTRPKGKSPVFLKSLLFMLHLVLLVLAVGSFLPIPQVQLASYKYFMILAIVVQLLRTYMVNGKPPFRPFDALQAWALKAFQTSDAQYIMYSFMLFTAFPIPPAVIPISVLALYHVSFHLARNYGNNKYYVKYLKPRHQWLQQNQSNALKLNAVCEIMVAGQLLFRMIFPQYRSILSLFAMVNFLKMRYQQSDASFYHRQVWQQIGQVTSPYINRIPLLQKGVGYLQRWFRGY